MLLAMVMVVYFVSINEGHSQGEIRAIAFSSLIIGNVFLILSSLSDTRNFLSVIKEKNLAVIVISLIALVILFITITIPFMKTVFSFEFPGYSHFIPSLIGALSLLFALEILKYTKQSVFTKNI
jgi:Ca2+-transporting ATPase